MFIFKILRFEPLTANLGHAMFKNIVCFNLILPLKLERYASGRLHCRNYYQTKLQSNSFPLQNVLVCMLPFSMIQVMNHCFVRLCTKLSWCACTGVEWREPGRAVLQWPERPGHSPGRDWRHLQPAGRPVLRARTVLRLHRGKGTNWPTCVSG